MEQKVDSDQNDDEIASRFVDPYPGPIESRDDIYDKDYEKQKIYIIIQLVFVHIFIYCLQS